MKQLFIVVTIIILIISLGNKVTPQVAVIPKPSDLQVLQGQFTLDRKTRICFDQSNAELRQVVDHFRDYITGLTGFEIKYSGQSSGTGNIIIKTGIPIVNIEGYSLRILPDGISLSARNSAGVFYGLQTICQLLPPETENRTGVKRDWNIPSVEINDYPRFPYRSFMLDVARHYQPVEVLKRYVDLLSFYKINYFHLHLTDDQGWRIEIKKYPRLQEIGAWRKQSIAGRADQKPLIYDGIRHGGYYTQAQLKELVKYAQEHFITLVPEIEMPGHSTAALAAYPELACFPKKFEVTPDYGVFEDVYCTRESTFRFLEDVLSEVAEIFPGKFIHIGGDECPKARWKTCPDCQQRMKDENLKTEEELQSYFIKRIRKFLAGKGRTIIGWDEIMEGGLAEGATIMYWRTWLGTGHIAEAAAAGFKVIMTPLEPFYFNLYEDEEREKSPLAYPGLIPLKKVYEYNPVPEKLSGQVVENIIGVQANLWSEYVKNEKIAEYMTFPRLCALSEVAWSPAEIKNYDDFIKRLVINSKYLDAWGVNYSRYFMKER